MNDSPRSQPIVRALPRPIDTFLLAQRLQSEPAWCWLDGEQAAVGESESAWSYLGVASEVKRAERGREREFLEELQSVTTHAPGHTPSQAVASASEGFHGGWVVALGYEFGVALLGLTPAADPVSPAFALRLDVVLAVHRESGRAELRGTDSAVGIWLETYGGILREAMGPDHGGAQPSVPTEGATDDIAQSAVHWRRGDGTYVADVEACKAAIHRGDAYVLCLTDTATVPGDFDPLDVYAQLKASGGAVRGAVIVAEKRALVSASPERFLRVQHNGQDGLRVETHPIKGTRPRGETQEQDQELATELAADPKERAENLMIVDLSRNDLSRVCVPGSVQTVGFLRIETHPQVHQMVSTVAGTLRPGLGIVDAISVCFPGGSMTGAPKRRAVELLAAIEGAPRGLYSGCFGWIDDSGSAELAMTIRGAELRGLGRPGERFGAGGQECVALVGAGGGVTIDSDPARELAETRLKARAILSALDASRGAIR